MKKDSSINTEFLASVILKTRKKLGKTQEEFGKLFHPTANKGNISKWEKGKTIPSNDRLNEISKLSGYSKEELLNGSLVSSILSIVKFAISYSDERYSMDTKNKKLNPEDYSFLSHAQSVHMFYQNDFFGKYPTYKESDNDDEAYVKAMDKYYINKKKLAEEYYLKETLKRAIASECNPNNKIDLISILLKVAENHFAGFTNDDKGLVGLVEFQLEGIIGTDIPNFIYSFNKETRKRKKVVNVNEELVDRIRDLITDTSEELYRIAEDFNATDD